MENNKIESFKRVMFGISMIIFPIILVFGFGSHPNLQSITIVKDANAWVSEIRHNEHLQIAHLTVLFSSALIINISLGMMNLLKGKSDILAIIGGSLAIIGAIILAADKGALCLVPSAFDTLNDYQYNNLIPGLQAMLDKKGLLWITYLIFLMPLGFISLSIGMIKTKLVSKWRGITLILSMLLFANPDIDLISLVASILLMISMGSIGHNILKKEFKTNFLQLRL